MKSKINAEAINAEAIIDAWFQRTVHSTIIQRDDVLYNKFHAAKEELKQLLSPSKNVEEQPIKESK